jgi:hypothetical protein
MTRTDMESSITLNEPSSEVIRIDKKGFHYRGELIEDAGEAYRLLLIYLQRHTSMHPEIIQQEVNWRELCVELFKVLSRPQKPPVDLMNRVEKALSL